MMKNIKITIEGESGSGKSTVAIFLIKKLVKLGYNFTPDSLKNEFGDSIIGEMGVFNFDEKYGDVENILRENKDLLNITFIEKQTKLTV